MTTHPIIGGAKDTPLRNLPALPPRGAARGEVDTIDVAIPLQMVLGMEGVTCLPQ
jgi:hypothetical protein